MPSSRVPPKRCDEALRDEVWRELRKGRDIKEAYVNGDKEGLDIYGLNDGQTVYVNPAHVLVETAIHELIHRVKPRWGERRVRAETQRIVKTFEDADVLRWYRQYQRVKTVSRKPFDPED
jgi:hypothetical protein